MSEAKIIGVGITDFGRFPDLTEEALAQCAIVEALMTLRASPPGCASLLLRQCHRRLAARPARAARTAHHRPGGVQHRQRLLQRRHRPQCGADALKAGQYDTVVVFGMDQLSSLGGGPLPLGKNDWNNRRGMIMPALYAMRAMRYLHDTTCRSTHWPTSR